MKIAKMPRILLLPLLYIMLYSPLHAQERFPPPSPTEIQESEQQVIELGKAEVLSLPYSDLYQFVMDRYWRGPYQNFDYHNSNPTALTPEQAKKPANILLHAHLSNQGQWMPFLEYCEEYNQARISEDEQCGPIFTLNYQEGSAQADLIQKIEEIKALYVQAGQTHVDLYLVGHSLGAIISAKYSFHPETWVEGTHVKKMVSIAGRLKNTEPPANTPFYAYCHCVLVYLDDVWSGIETHPDLVELYCIAAQNDWLVPSESVLVAHHEKNNVIIPDTGHGLIARSKAAAEQVIQWLFKTYD